MSDDMREDELLNFLKAELELSQKANVYQEFPVRSLKGLLGPDAVIEDQGRIYIVEVKSKASVESLGRLSLAKELVEKQSSELGQPILVLAARIFPAKVKELSKYLDVRTVNLPRDSGLAPREYSRSPISNITSEKSWRVICRLLREKSTSIRQLSILEGVSYAWSNKVISTLINQAVVSRNWNYVQISDVPKLLNAVAWGRPFENLFIEEVVSEYQNALVAAQEISSFLSVSGINHAFTSSTSGGLYTGSAFRHDMLYLYVERDQLKKVEDLIGPRGKDGITVRLYLPDRNVFNGARQLESIVLTTPEQTILDLAGSGYSTRDLTRAMVDYYAKL